jgi:cytochrome c biogenesis protein CcdA
MMLGRGTLGQDQRKLRSGRHTERFRDTVRRRRLGAVPRITGLALVVLLVVTATTHAPALADGVVHFYYFFKGGCPVCAGVHAEVVEPLRTEFGTQIAVAELDIQDPAVLEFLLLLEEQAKVKEPTIPEVFIGTDALIGADPIREQLRQRIEFYLARGGVALPIVAGATPPAPAATQECKECDDIHAAQRTAVASQATPSPEATPSATSIPSVEPPVYLAYFYQPGCDVCARAEHDLQYVVEKHPQLQVQRYDINEEAALNQYLCQRAGVPEIKHLTAPALFVADRYLLESDINGNAIEALIQPYLSTGAAEPWAGYEQGQDSARQRIVERFRSLGLWTVLGAGLLDGVNPCAFATMIFLISYLAVRKRQGRELLATGFAFTLGVFLAYLGVGLGLLKFLTSLPALNVIGKWLYGVTLVLCLLLAWGSFSDYLKARQGRLEDMSLKLPERLRGSIHGWIREGSKAQNYVLASFFLGLVVSIIELACTGQVYLPTIIFVLGLPEWRARAAVALLAYNVVFVVPLIIIFLMVYFGTTSKQLLNWMNRRAATVKLGTGVLFLLLAAWLGYSLVSL